jgi:hypothetical protein
MATERIWRRSSRSTNGANCVELFWRRSSRSTNNANCVELGNTLNLLRDSKNPGPVLAGDVRSLLRAIQSGQLEHP